MADTMIPDEELHLHERPYAHRLCVIVGLALLSLSLLAGRVAAADPAACSATKARGDDPGLSILPTDRLPRGWGASARKGPPVDTWGNPIVNERPGLPGWAQRDVDDLRLEIAKTHASLRELPEDLRGPTEDLLGNYIGQAIVRGIDAKDLIDVRRDASPRVGNEILGFLHAYENRKREFAPIDGYEYRPTEYDAETVSLVEHFGGSLHEIRTADPAHRDAAVDSESTALGGSGCYVISTPSLGMAALSGATSIWSGVNVDDAKEPFFTTPMRLNSMCGVFTDLVWVSTNGLVHPRGGGDGAGVDEPSNVAIPSATLPNSFVAPSWDDYQVRFGLGFIDRVSYKIEGAVGQRTLVVEWRSVGHVGGDVFDTHSFQFVFREEDLGIEFRYGPWNADETVDSATVGIELPDDGTVGQCLDCTATNRTPATNLLFLPRVRPANDEVENAVCIDFDGPVSGSTLNASSAPFRRTSACDDRDVYDVWYYLDAPDGEVTFDTCGARLQHMTLVVENEGFFDCAGDDCGFGGTKLTGDLEGGMRYWVRAAGKDYTQGRFALTATPTVRPPGDKCDDAIAIGGSEPTVLSTTNDNSGCESESSCAGCNDNFDEWFTWTAPISGNAVATTCSPITVPLDTTLAVFDACGGTELAFNNDINDSFFSTRCPHSSTSSRVSWPVTAGTTYRLRVAGVGLTRGAYELHLRASPLFSDGFEWGHTAAWSAAFL